MNEKLLDRVKGLQGGAVACGDQQMLSEWSSLYEGVHEGEVSYPAVRDFEVRLKNMARVNRLDATLPADRRRLVLSASPEQADNSELAQLEREASAACGMWIGRDETKPK